MTDNNDGTSTRPRRSTRTSAKTPAKIGVGAPAPDPAADESPVQAKRKARDTGKSPAEKLEYLLTNSKSKLTKIDISVSRTASAATAAASRCVYQSTGELELTRPITL